MPIGLCKIVIVYQRRPLAHVKASLRSVKASYCASSFRIKFDQPVQRHRQVDAKSSQLGDALLLPHGLHNRVQSHNSVNRGIVTVGLTEPNIYQIQCVSWFRMSSFRAATTISRANSRRDAGNMLSGTKKRCVPMAPIIIAARPRAASPDNGRISSPMPPANSKQPVT